MLFVEEGCIVVVYVRTSPTMSGPSQTDHGDGDGCLEFSQVRKYGCDISTHAIRNSAHLADCAFGRKVRPVGSLG